MISPQLKSRVEALAVNEARKAIAEGATAPWEGKILENSHYLMDHFHLRRDAPSRRDVVRVYEAAFLATINAEAPKSRGSLSGFGVWDEFKTGKQAPALLLSLGFEVQGVKEDGGNWWRTYRRTVPGVGSLQVEFVVNEGAWTARIRIERIGAYSRTLVEAWTVDLYPPWSPGDNLVEFKQALSEALVAFDVLLESPPPPPPRRVVESEAMVEYAREILDEGDFDTVSGTYAYFSGWHGGQSSWSYQALSILGQDFHPGMGWSESNLEEGEIDAYNLAVEKFGGEPYEVAEQ